MSATDRIAEVRDENETALSRLGSSKAIYAITSGEMTGDAVREAAADRAHAASETFAAWIAEEENADAASLYDGAVEQEAAHYERVVEDEAYSPEAVPPIQEELREAEETLERIGGLVGHAIVAEKLSGQLAGFFVGEADPQTASLFREYKDDLEDRQERAAAHLEELCDGEADWETVTGAATAAIQAAYEEYTERLEAMGVNPKPVC